jgi:GWxTD domain-containing protein
MVQPGQSRLHNRTGQDARPEEYPAFSNGPSSGLWSWSWSVLHPCASVARALALHRIGLPARKWALIGLACSALGTRVSTAAEIPPLRAEQPPDFTADFVLSLDGEGHPAMAVTVTVPYPGLQWVVLRSPGIEARFAADVEISVSFRPRKGGQLRGDVWERRLVVGSFDVSRSPRAAAVERRKLDIPPGTFDVTVTARDLNAGTESRASDRVTVPDYSKVPVGFADLELGVRDSSGAFHPVATRVFGADVGLLAARAQMFDRRPGGWPRHYAFRWRVLDDIGQKLKEGTSEITMARSAEPVVIGPVDADLFVGPYVFEVELAEKGSRWRVERSFEVEESGPPRGAEFERILEPLSYIATSEEIDRLHALPADQQAAGWERFWRPRDPTPDTPRNEALIEFIRRLHYAERHFQGYGPGWRSDMGRIYIRYGPPDQIESHAPTTDSPQLEVWYYHNPFRRFVFADREGFGRYVLMSPVGE